MKIEEQYDKLFRYCYMKTRDIHIAEDITQEAFLRFLDSKSYKEIGKQMPYLYTIARNLCNDYFRQNKTVELNENIPAPEIKNNNLEEALDKLNEEEKELLFLRYTNDSSINDLAKHYKISRFTVSRRIKKALSHLKEVYENE